MAFKFGLRVGVGLGVVAAVLVTVLSVTILGGGEGGTSAPKNAASGEAVDEVTAAAELRRASQDRVEVGSPRLQLRGRVLGSNGLPASDAHVVLTAPELESDQQVIWTGRSGADGQFLALLEHPGAGEVDAAAWRVGDGRASARNIDLDTILTLELVPEGWLVGTVTDRDTGRTLEGAEVRGAGVRAYTNALGRYELAPGRGRTKLAVAILGEGYARESEVLVLPSAGVLERDYQLVPLSMVAVRIVDDRSGDAVGGAVARCTADWRAETVASQEGWIDVSCLASANWALEVEATGFLATRWEFSSGACESIAGASVRLPPAGVINVQVVDPNGLPVNGAEVVVSPAKRERGQEWRVPMPLQTGLNADAAFYIQEAHLFASSNDEGVAQVWVAPSESPYRLDVSKDGFVLQEGLNCIVRESKEVATIRVELSRGGTVRGVITKGGIGWREGDVYWRQPGVATGGWTDPDENGAYVLKDVPQGKVEICLRSYLGEDPEPQSLWVNVGQEHRLDFLLPLE